MTTWTQPLRRLTAVALASFCFAAQAGEITAYTSLEEDDVKVYLDAFNKAKPGIKVNVLRLSTGDLAARMLAEKSNPRHDVIWGWAVTQMVDPAVPGDGRTVQASGHRQGQCPVQGPGRALVRDDRLFRRLLRQYRSAEEEQPADAQRRGRTC